MRSRSRFELLTHLWGAGRATPVATSVFAACRYVAAAAWRSVSQASSSAVAPSRSSPVVCAGIHMSEIPSFSYELLWGERAIRSVANLTRQDGEEFMELAPKVPVRTEIREFRLGEANEALHHLRAGELRGSAVLKIG